MVDIAKFNYFKSHSCGERGRGGWCRAQTRRYEMGLQRNVVGLGYLPGVDCRKTSESSLVTFQRERMGARLGWQPVRMKRCNWIGGMCLGRNDHPASVSGLSHLVHVPDISVPGLRVHTQQGLNR